MRIFLSILTLFLSISVFAQTDIPGCNLEIACNYNPDATINDGSCDFVSCLVLGCTDSAACNYDSAATLNDGSCDYLSCLVQGCTLADACNFDLSAEVNDGSCEFTSCAGCTNEFADNFDATSTIDDGSCNPIEGCTNPQACNFDANANSDDGSCDFISCLATGCTDATACNYDMEAQVNDGTCSYPSSGRDCEGNCLEDADGDDICDGDEIPGCTSETALNFSDVATDDDGSCIEPVAGCTDPEACNFDVLATNENGTCEFTSCAGCLQESACNYDSSALYADESCEFPPFGYDCDGECLLDVDGDGVCDPFEIVGCQDDSACNFDPTATDPGNCSFASPNFDCDGNSLKPIFTSFPADVTLQAWQVPLSEDAVVEAIVSPFAPSFEATFNGNDCYELQNAPVIEFAGETRIDGVCEHDYTLFRSWTATDCSGYNRTRQQIIIVVDTVSPELFVPSDMVILCEDVETVDLGQAFGQDDCGEVSIGISTTIVPGACEGNYTIVRSFLATDPCLNETIGEQTIEVVDNQAPVITALSDLTLGCDAVVPSDLPEVSDNCSDVSIVVEETELAGVCPQERTVERLFTATDACGNSSTSLQKVIFVDEEAPAIVAGFSGCEIPADCAIEINGLEGESLPEADLTLLDNCDDAPTWSHTDEVLLTSNAAQTILRTYTAADACGNALEVSEVYNVTLVYEGCSDDAACNYDAEVNVLDDSCEYCSCGTNPCGCLDEEACNFDANAAYDDLSCEFADPGYNCEGVCDDVNQNDICDIEEAGCTDSQACNYDEVAAVDDGSCDYCCGYDTFTSSEAGYGVDIELVQTHAEGSLAGLSTYRVYVTMASSEDVLTAVTGSDEFPLELATTTSFYQNVFGGCLGSNISPAMMVVAPDAAYDSWVTIGATSSDDVAEGETQLIPGVWIEEFEAGSSIVVNDGLGSGWFIIPPGGMNGIAGDDNRVLVAQLTTDGQISGSFRTQIFPEGDQANDIRPDMTFAQAPLGAFACPIIESGPADAVVSCEDELVMPTGSDFVVSYASATAEALGCAGDLIVNLVQDNVSEGDCPGNYVIERIVSVTNCAGGSATYAFLIQVQDIVDPEFLFVPSDYTTECSVELVLDSASASDNCGEVAIEVSSETFDGEAAGNYTVVRTFVATDLCGNSSSAQQTITVEDTTAPEFTSVPADYTSECSDDLMLDDASASDNCGEVTIEVSSQTIAGDATGNYTMVRTFTATDDAGNSSSAQQTITVEDTTAPEFTSVPSDYNSECSDDLILDDATAVDNCDGVILEVSSETLAGDAAGNYTLVRTFTATDDAGNSSQAQQTITVEDTTAPEFTSVPADYTSECSDDLILDDASASDNCGDVTIEVSSETIAGGCEGSYTVVRTFTATDDAGNSSSAQQTIVVEDTTAPELSIPSDYTAECSDELVFDDANAVDNCTSCVDAFDFTSTVEGYGLSLELVASHSDGVLAGLQTYRVYLDVSSSADQVTSITGNDEFALALNTTTSFYQNAFGGATSNDLTPGALALVPELAYDSYVTVGLTQEPGLNEGSVELIPGSWSDSFESGSSFEVNDGVGSGWYIVPPVAINGLGGDDQRVLVAQLTTDGDLSGQFRTQVFPGGDQINDVRADLTFSHSRSCSELTLEVSSETIAGDAVGNYAIVRTFTATDACGNSSSAQQTIVVEDTTAPELSIPSDYTAECSDELVFDDANAVDNCTSCVDAFDFTSTVEGYGLSLELVASHSDGVLADLQTYRVYLDVSSSADQVTSITGNDEFALALNTTTSFYQNELGGATSNGLTPGALALVPELAYDSYVTVGLTQEPGLNEGSVELIPGSWADSFESGSSFEVNDGVGSGWYIVPPVAINGLGGDDQRVLIAQLTTDGDLSGQFRTQVFPGGDQINDVRADLTFSHSRSCSELTLEVSSETIAGGCEGSYTVVRTFTATDDAGNSSSAQQTIVVEDTTAPELSIPSDYTAECSDELVFDDANAVDNCTSCVDAFDFTSTVEGYGLSLELVASHSDGVLADLQTYRVYLDVSSSEDQVTSITGNDEFALALNTTTSFYQNELGGATSNGLTPGALALVPELAYDSYVTVGLTQEPGLNEGSVELIPGSWADSFESGSSFEVNDGVGSGWYIVPPVAINGLGGDDQRVLIAQLTTDGDLSGQFRTQVFPGGDQINDVRADLTFSHSRSCSELTLEVSSETIAGDAAGNYAIVRTFTATDACGNSSEETQTITVEDTTAPEFTSVPADYTSECSDDLILDDATASDNCGEVTIEVSSETIEGDAAGNYTVIRTFTATDDAGNSTSATQTITVEDTTAPEFTSVPADYTSECSDDLILEDATASDNCGEVTIEVSSETIAGDAAGNYTVVRTFTATDDAGNSSLATQTITVEDTTAPEFTSVPADYTSECSDDLILDDATASDNCGEVTIEVSSETIEGDAVGNYTVIRTFTATDDAGNSTSATQTISVQDTTAPEFTSVPADYTSECSDDLILDDATASDNCGEVTIDVSSETIEGDAAGNYTLVRTFTATDDAGNSSQAQQTITVEDTTAPEFTSVPADYTSECSDDLILDDATASDNCGDVTIEVSSETIEGDAAGNYTVIRTFTATDDAGNSSSAQQTITVQDTTAPEFTSVPADYTSECSDDLILDDATASDNCGEVTIEVSSETIAGDAAGNYSVVRTFTATDDAGNSTSATQTITVQDTTAPEFTSVPADYTSECSDDLILDDATASDNCGEVTIEVSSETIEGDAVGNYTVVRTFTATDDAGNSSSAQQTITVEDTTVPEFTSVPADYTSECSDDLILDDATASDNCGEVTIEVSSETIEGDAAGNYTVIRTFTATDDAGNSTSATQTITVEDTTAPEFTSVPADYTSECSDDLILDDATASDNCGEVTIEVSSETIEGDAAGNYTVVRTFTATDDAGNSSSAQQTITVQDTTAPEFTSVPADYTSECSDDLILDDATASDNCGEVTIEVSSETIAGNAAGNYTVVRTFTATDDAGNSSQAQQTITVEDTTAPEFTSVPADYTSECSDDLILDDATASDNCGEVTIEVSSETIEGDAAGNYTVVRTFTATDDAGNSSSAQQTITVQDTTAPEFTSVPADYTSECSDDLILDDATASDNCGDVTIEVSSETIAGNAAGNYTVVRTFTATDDAGNSSQAQQTITVEDTTAPEFTSVPADYTSECSDDLILDDATASDNCGEVTIEVSSETIAGNAAGNYTVVRTFTATDDAGNSSSAQQTITVQDTTAPEFTSVPSDYTSECSDDLILDDATASDNCGEVTIEVSSETIEGDAAGNYTVIRTFTATDDAGNSSQAQQTISVQDTTAPEFTSVPADYTSECSDDLILDDATASDNCGEVTIEVSSETIAGDAAGNYSVVRTFTATDDAGNSTSATQTITVQDTTAPEFTSVPADYTSECSDDLILDDATASDNCGEVTIEVSSETIEGDAVGNYTVVRTFTATDDAGNSSSAQQTITVQDTTAPEFTSVPSDYTSECSDDLILDDATASDNCGEVTIDVSSETIAGDAAGNYTVIRTFTATDDAGNSTSATQTITVEDTTAPEFTSVPSDYTSECSDDLILDDATASDNCGEITIEVSSETIAGGCSHEYQIVRTFTATDDAGNNTAATQVISVVDTTGPDLFVPPSYEADCGDELLLLDALASDACGLALVTLEESYDYSCAQGYVLTRTFTALDECFNETIGVQTITVSDSEAPAFTFVPEGYSAECSDELVLDNASAIDNCGDAVITVVNDTIAGDCANAFTLVRTFTADDGCGNTTSATQTIEVSDTTAPEFTFVPDDQVIECNISLDVTMATATDQCGEVTVEVAEVYEQGACGGAYVITRTFTAVDACGNSNSAVQTITQQDTTSPLLDIASDVTIECDEPAPAAEYTASDACGAVTVEVLEEIVPGSCPQSMTIVRTYIATDDCGNATSATQTIEVVDTTAPTFTYTPESASIVYEAEGDTLAVPFVVVIDNCDTEASWSVEETILVDLPNELTVERVYTASDACGNQTLFTEVATLVLQVLGCTDPDACNYESFANEDDDSCFYPLYSYDCDGNCLNDDNDNGICDELEVSGCTNPDNPGYNPEANVDDGSCLTGGCTIEFACNFDAAAEFQIAGACEFDSCAGCTSEEACNYDSEATLNDGSCEFPAYGYGCDGECLNDEDGDGICDEFEIAGCTDPSNPAYNPAATDDDGSCLVAGCLLPFACNFEPTADYLDIALCDLNSCSGCTDPEACTFDPLATLNAPADCTYPASQFVDCDGNCNNDADGDGICDELEIPGCTDIAASNYSPFATDDNGTCIIEVGGCTLPFACNYDPSADFYLPGSCDFSCLFGMPFDGEACADELACNFGLDEPCMYFDANGSLCAQVGCMNEAACNFDADAQINSGCEYASCQVFGCTNSNACNFDLSASTEDGSCEYVTCLGCMDSEASNFDPEATVDNGQCQFDVIGCTLLIACNYDPTATVNDGSCDFTGCFGCVTPSACNYDQGALYPDGSCEFASNGQDCSGNCLVDSDGDSVCDASEVVGCTDPDALNFNANATDESGTCQYASTGCTNQTACNFDFTAQEDDGTCDFETCSGCIVSWACNYDEGATLSDGSCVFPDAFGVCPSVCEFDEDGDGICDANEVSGCTYFNASNFNPLATDDNGNCVFEGCISPDFSSYNSLANTNDGQCTNAPASADFTGDGVVQLEDLLEFLVAYGTSGPEWGLEWIQDGCSVVAMGIADMDVNATGCTYPTAANFDPSAPFDLGTCVWLGCTDSEALNFNALATLDDSSCSYNVCPDFNGDGQVQTQDLLDFLIAWGTVYE